MARSQFQARDLDAALGLIDKALKMESAADAWVLKERILTEKATRGERAIGSQSRNKVEENDRLNDQSLISRTV